MLAGQQDAKQHGDWPVNRAANNGMLATVTAAISELTRSSAKQTSPLPMPR